MKNSLSQWLDRIEKVHNKDCDMGLTRIKSVAQILDILHCACPVITVSGTNGKGSCVALLEQIYLKEGYKTGVFVSPFLFSFNELIRINGNDIDDTTLCEAFAKIDQKRGNIPLTLFEFATLAALLIFHKKDLDVVILEVGMGGRQDCVNIIDPDVAIISSIGIDHVSFLGDTREKIAVEKAGIFRSFKPAVCGDANPPKTLLEYVKKHRVPLFQQGRDFKYLMGEDCWSWHYQDFSLNDLPLPKLYVQNASTILMAIYLLKDLLPVNLKSIKTGIKKTNLLGRFQVKESKVTQIFDVAHNPQSALLLAENLRKQQNACEKTRAVFSVLSNKDVKEIISPLKDIVQEWYIAPLKILDHAVGSTRQAMPLDLLEKSFKEMGIRPQSFLTIDEAYRSALKNSKSGDRIVAFGSFNTVRECWLVSV